MKHGGGVRISPRVSSVAAYRGSRGHHISRVTTLWYYSLICARVFCFLRSSSLSSRIKMLFLTDLDPIDLT